MKPFSLILIPMIFLFSCTQKEKPTQPSSTHADLSLFRTWEGLILDSAGIQYYYTFIFHDSNSFSMIRRKHDTNTGLDSSVMDSFSMHITDSLPIIIFGPDSARSRMFWKIISDSIFIYPADNYFTLIRSLGSSSNSIYGIWSLTTGAYQSYSEYTPDSIITTTNFGTPRTAVKCVYDHGWHYTTPSFNYCYHISGNTLFVTPVSTYDYFFLKAKQ